MKYYSGRMNRGHQSAVIWSTLTGETLIVTMYSIWFTAKVSPGMSSNLKIFIKHVKNQNEIYSIILYANNILYKNNKK